MSLRVSLAYKDGYFKINREERNLAAILYHCLLLDGNMKRFLDLIGCNHDIVEEEVGIYFEYAFIRDLWKSIKKSDNISKRNYILDNLLLKNRRDLEKMSISEFNIHFGGYTMKGGKVTTSKHYIESPSNWSIKYLNGKLDNEEFLRICKFKWCFNAKPDIVINTSHKTAVCIETKYKSGEGKYPSGEDSKVFNLRGLEKVGQLAIQRMLMQEILEVQTDFVYVKSKKTATDPGKTLTWKQVFDLLDTTKCPPFLRDWLKELK